MATRKPGQQRPASSRLVQGLGLGFTTRDTKTKALQISILEGFADHVPEPSVASALDVCSGATPADVRQYNIVVQSSRSKPDISTSLRIGHFYFVPTANRPPGVAAK
jgi:hypothetical protein